MTLSILPCTDCTSVNDIPEPVGVSFWALRSEALKDALEKACQSLGFLPRPSETEEDDRASLYISDDEGDDLLQVITSSADEGKSFLDQDVNTLNELPHVFANIPRTAQGSFIVIF